MLNKNGSSTFKKDFPLAQVCTLKVGGPAKFYTEVDSIEAMKEALSFCQRHRYTYFILGKGSNCLFDDKGFNGVVIANKISFLKKLHPNIYYAGSGFSFSRLGIQTAKECYSGLEFASGIPGSVGGAIFMNAGANGKQTCDSLVSVDYLEEDGNISTYQKDDLTFSYRYSSFQEKKGVILAAKFCLKKDNKSRATQIDFIQYRKHTQPYNKPSAGCIFCNPTNQKAGFLIEKAGLKGFTIGGAKVSTQHANFIINTGNAKAKDILLLIKHIREKIKHETGVLLKSEVRYISYDGLEKNL